MSELLDLSGLKQPLALGDHICIMRPRQNLFKDLNYRHHAIVSSVEGDTIRIIHLVFLGEDESFKDSMVQETDLVPFLNGQPASDLHVVRYGATESEQKEANEKFQFGEVHCESCNPPEKVVEEARSKLGIKGYCMFEENCEHFAVCCKTGNSRSLQVEALMEFIKETASKIEEVEPETKELFMKYAKEYHEPVKKLLADVLVNERNFNDVLDEMMSR